MTVTPRPASLGPFACFPANGGTSSVHLTDRPRHTANETLTRRDLILRWGAVLATVAIILAAPVPAGITVKSWRLLAIFLGTIVGSIVRPVPAGAIVLLGVAAVAFTGTLTPAQALGGYADPIVWLVLCAFFISRGVVKTGLGRRIAFLFIRAIGTRSIGLSYALIATDTLLASLVPSNGARAGGVMFPVAKSLAEAYDSTPGPTRRRLGSFLMTTVYQCDVIACAMFLTGQASNVLIAKFAKDAAGVELSYARWFIGRHRARAAVAAARSAADLPLFPPDVRRTPHAAEFAAQELAQLGRMSRGERIMLLGLRARRRTLDDDGWHQINYAVVALGRRLRAAADERARLGRRRQRAQRVGRLHLVRRPGADGRGVRRDGDHEAVRRDGGGCTSGWPWGAALAVLLLVYFYAHYGFASITAHATAMYTPFLVVTIAAGAPPALAVLSLAYFSNLSASLTHFGTTPAPIYFGAAVRDAARMVEVRVHRFARDDRDLEHRRRRVVEAAGLVVIGMQWRCRYRAPGFTGDVTMGRPSGGDSDKRSDALVRRRSRADSAASHARHGEAAPTVDREAADRAAGKTRCREATAGQA